MVHEHVYGRKQQSMLWSTIEDYHNEHSLILDDKLPSKSITYNFAKLVVRKSMSVATDVDTMYSALHLVWASWSQLLLVHLQALQLLVILSSTETSSQEVIKKLRFLA